MTAQPSQETVKPETQAYRNDRAIAESILALEKLYDASVRPSHQIALVTAYRERIETAATQKLEAENQDLRDSIGVLKEEKVELEAEKAELGVENFAQTVHIVELNKKLTALRSQLDGMTKALTDELRGAELQVELFHDRVSKGEEHLRAFGSEAWRRANRLRAALTTPPQPVAGQKEGDAL